MERVYRVFFHELGHFVAHELNQKHYGTLGANAISIYKCKEDPNEYCGGTDLVKPDRFDPKDSAPPPLERLAENLASVVYGCAFQAYHSNTEFMNCFCTNGHGTYDLNKWASFLGHHKVDNKKELIHALEKHIEKISGNKALENFMQINPLDYLVPKKENAEVYAVNIENLRRNISGFIDAHSQLYKELVEEFKTLLPNHEKQDDDKIIK